MARIARIVLPNSPHHVTQRGNRRQQTFFCEEDYAVYLRLLTKWCRHFAVRIEAYCLMPNHVHLVLVPETEPGLAAAMSEIHRRYTQRVNTREDWQGHLWQGRFFSVPLDEMHHQNAMNYVELNPVRAGLVSDPCEYKWSSANEASERLRTYRDGDPDFTTLRKMTATGRPVGSEAFYERIASTTGVDVRRKTPGPKRDK